MQSRGLWGLGIGLPIVAATVVFSLNRPQSAEGESPPGGRIDITSGPETHPDRSASMSVAVDSTASDPDADDRDAEPLRRAPRSIHRTGRLTLDPNRLVRIHARFGGQVVAIGDFVAPGGGAALDTCRSVDRGAGPTVGDASSSASTPAAPPAKRTLRYGDPVSRGQLLAVVWSKEFGEKKSDLVNALSKLHLDRGQYERLCSLEQGLVAERQVIEARQQFEADEIEVERIERTLRSWRVEDREIEGIRDEAGRIHRGEKLDDHKIAQTWAEVEVRAPFAGLLLEKNITAGDIVDSNLDLFKVGDLSSLVVLIDLFEEDLPLVSAVDPRSRRWTIRLKSAPDSAGVAGRFEVIGDMVDPRQHTVALMGWLANPLLKLRAGQFVTADIPLQ